MRWAQAAGVEVGPGRGLVCATYTSAELAPASGQNPPRLHCSHDDAPVPALKEPALQTSHVAAPCAAAYWPGKHGKQLTLPLKEVCVPTPQGEHALPGDALDPGGHALHRGDSRARSKPAVQTVHCECTAEKSMCLCRPQSTQ